MSIHNIGTCDCWDCQTRLIQLESEPPSFGDAIALYIRHLAEEGIPLTAEITVAAVLDDLCDLAEIPVPLAVSTAIRELTA